MTNDRRLPQILARCTLAGLPLLMLGTPPAVAAELNNGPDEQAGWAVGRPLQVIDREALQATGHTDIGAALSALLPAYRFTAPVAVNGDDHVRTGTLRGLAPDQMVVLIDGKRQHTASKFYTSDQAGRGSVGVDLALLPMTAVERVEILPGGAGGRFGSGALAGVINIVLDDTASGGRFNAGFGQRRSAIEGVPRFMGTDVNNATGTIRLGLSGEFTEDDGDGDDLSLQGSWGFGLGDGGFMRLSAEYQQRNTTNRAGYDSRQQYPLNADGSFDVREQTLDRRNSSYGDPDLEELNILFNAAMPVAEQMTFYGFTFLGTRKAQSFAPFVRPVDPQNVIAIYPDGTLPEIESDIDDRSFTIGFRGEHWGWKWDASYNQRDDELDLGLTNSLNPTFGAGSPTDFVTGNNETKLITLQADAQRGWRPDWLYGELTVAAGVASIEEEYEIESGDLAADFNAGLADLSDGPVPAAAVGFAGFPIEIEKSRETSAVYTSVSADVHRGLMLSASTRLDDLDDLGQILSADFAAKARLTETLSARVAIGRGFHAPSLAQTTYTRPVDTVTASGIEQSGIYTPDGRVSAALGGDALEEQTANHANLGLQYAPHPQIELSLDIWQVEIDDRVVLSELQDGPAAVEALASAGLADVTGAQFTLNGLDSRTRGVDARGAYRTEWFGGELDAEIAYSQHRTTTGNLQSLTTTLGDTLTPLGARAAAQLEDEQPDSKLIAQAHWQRGAFGLHARFTRYGEVIDYGAGDSEPLKMGPAWLMDLEARYQVNEQLTFTVGAHNLLNEYPETLNDDPGAPSVQARFPYSGYAPFDVSGRLMYARMALNLD